MFKKQRIANNRHQFCIRGQRAKQREGSKAAGRKQCQTILLRLEHIRMWSAFPRTLSTQHTRAHGGPLGVASPDTLPPVPEPEGRHVHYRSKPLSDQEPQMDSYFASFRKCTFLE